MASPVFTNNEIFQEGGRGAAINPAFNDSKVLTIENTLQKTFLVFGILLASAAVGWMFPIVMIPALIIALVVGLIVAFKRKPNPAMTIAYAIFEGLAVGAISGVLENAYPGVVSQAVLATLCVVGTVLALFVSGKLRATPKVTKVFVVAMSAYLLFSVVNFFIMITGASDQAWGLRSVEIFGIPLGLIIGVLAVVMGAYSLVLDFTFIQNAVDKKVDSSFGWTAAFGILVTVVWIYLEILRILSIMRGR
jgi:uncharacterized YccA/Bax inhibitor family protein